MTVIKSNVLTYLNKVGQRMTQRLKLSVPIQKVFSDYTIDLSIAVPLAVHPEDELCASKTGLPNTKTSHIFMVSVNMGTEKK